nr:MAG TPA: hypothetical protein [Caudoviricetes sp.]DAP75867.1 MAG TPA: hypothetical protein [Caudoviricetes sp.]
MISATYICLFSIVHTLPTFFFYYTAFVLNYKKNLRKVSKYVILHTT